MMWGGDIVQDETYRVGSFNSVTNELTFSTPQIPGDASKIDNTTSLLQSTVASGFYTVSGNVNCSDGITVQGTIHLILMDGCKLEVGGITVGEDAVLNIYAQSDGDNVGTLISDISSSDFKEENAAIGGQGTNKAGPIIIHGGNVTGTSGSYGAGIGGGKDEAGTVTIYGGTVKGTADTGAGIGGGTNGDGKVIIYGGNVTGTSRSYGAGIGGGSGTTTTNGGTGTVTIYGGIVTGSSNDGGAGIGGGSGSNITNGGKGTVTICGGTVTGSSGIGGAGIGGGNNVAVDSNGENGEGEVIISGGEVKGTSYIGAGIGGGNMGKGTVNITGGTVTGTSTGIGAGIGGGSEEAGEVTIEEGVTCVQGIGGSVPGIGSGYKSDAAATITIGTSLSYATNSSSMPKDEDVKTLWNAENYEFLKYVKVMKAPEIDATVPTPSESTSTSSSNATTIIPQWIPTTPEEIRAFTLFGSASDVVDDDFYEILNEDIATMIRMVQGPKCIAVMDAYAPYGMELVRTYGILPLGFSLDNIIYTSDKELEVVLKIPTSLQEEGATFKMICVSEDGMPYILDDLDTNPTTITFKTNKFYAVIRQIITIRNTLLTSYYY